MVDGGRVCRKTFLLLPNVSEKMIDNVQHSLSKNALATRWHGKLRRLPSNTISFDDNKGVVEFLQTYAEANTTLLPGRIPGYKYTDVPLLPFSTTKHHQWLVELTSKWHTPPLVRSEDKRHPTSWSQSQSVTSVGYASQTGQHSNYAVANQPEEQKSVVSAKNNTNYLNPFPLYFIQKAEEDLLLATKERSYYRAVCDMAKYTVRQTFQQAGTFTPCPPSSRLPPCPLPPAVHYSFNTAQQVHFW